MTELQMKKINLPSGLEFLITALMVIFVNVFSFYTQDLISYNEGKGWDGVDYYKIADDISNNMVPEARAPFVYRIGTPFLASIVEPQNLMAAFTKINIIASSLIPFALLFWISLFYRGLFFRILPVALFSFTWHAPIRMTYFYPIHTDPLAILIMLVLLITLNFLFNNEISKSANQKLFVLFTLLTIIGAFFREICLIPALLYLLVSIKINKPIFNNELNRSKLNLVQRIKSTFHAFELKNKMAFIPILTGFVVLFGIKLFVMNTVSYSFWGAAISWIYRKSFFMYIHSWLIAFGPILFVLIYHFKESYNFLRTNQLSGFFIIIIALLGLAGGSDTERIIYWSMPIVYIMIIKILSINKEIYKNAFMIFYMVVIQLISMRLFWVIPDYPNNYSSKIPILTSIGSDFPYLDLWTWHGNLKTNLLSFLGYVIAFIIFYSIHKVISLKKVG